MTDTDTKVEASADDVRPEVKEDAEAGFALKLNTFSLRFLSICTIFGAILILRYCCFIHYVPSLTWQSVLPLVATAAFVGLVAASYLFFGLFCPSIFMMQEEAGFVAQEAFALLHGWLVNDGPSAEKVRSHTHRDHAAKPNKESTSLKPTESSASKKRHLTEDHRRVWCYGFGLLVVAGLLMWIILTPASQWTVNWILLMVVIPSFAFAGIYWWIEFKCFKLGLWKAIWKSVWLFASLMSVSVGYVSLMLLGVIQFLSNDTTWLYVIGACVLTNLMLFIVTHRKIRGQIALVSFCVCLLLVLLYPLPAAIALRTAGVVQVHHSFFIVDKSCGEAARRMDFPTVNLDSTHTLIYGCLLESSIGSEYLISQRNPQNLAEPPLLGDTTFVIPKEHVVASGIFAIGTLGLHPGIIVLRTIKNPASESFKQLPTGGTPPAASPEPSHVQWGVVLNSKTKGGIVVVTQEGGHPHFTVFDDWILQSQSISYLDNPASLEDPTFDSWTREDLDTVTSSLPRKNGAQFACDLWSHVNQDSRTSGASSLTPSVVR